MKSLRIPVQSQIDPSKMIEGFNIITKQLVRRPDIDDPNYKPIVWEHIHNYLMIAEETMKGMMYDLYEVKAIINAFRGCEEEMSTPEFIKRMTKVIKTYQATLIFN